MIPSEIGVPLPLSWGLIHLPQGTGRWKAVSLVCDVISLLIHLGHCLLPSCPFWVGGSLSGWEENLDPLAPLCSALPNVYPSSLSL